MTLLIHFRALVLAALTAALLSACNSPVKDPAPVEERSGVHRSSPGLSGAATTSQGDSSKPLPGSENAGKPGYYTVQRGDTLTRIGLDHGQGWRDLARWNNLTNPDQIETGQVLRVVPPGSSVESPGVLVRPVVASSGALSPSPVPGNPVPVKPQSASVAAIATSHDEGLGFIWPANGAVITGFDETKNKGLDIGGKAGDPVIAAADGQVVYAGSGLRGYGNLLILKHNNTFLTAYAHNQGLLVKEDQKVRKGQKIAEMGKSDADRVKLHFEVRRQGKPVDPAKYLPAR